MTDILFSGAQIFDFPIILNFSTVTNLPVSLKCLQCVLRHYLSRLLSEQVWCLRTAEDWLALNAGVRARERKSQSLVPQKEWPSICWRNSVHIFMCQHQRPGCCIIMPHWSLSYLYVSVCYPEVTGIVCAETRRKKGAVIFSDFPPLPSLFLSLCMWFLPLFV